MSDTNLDRVQRYDEDVKSGGLVRANDGAFAAIDDVRAAVALDIADLERRHAAEVVRLKASLHAEASGRQIAEGIAYDRRSELDTALMRLAALQEQLTGDVARATITERRACVATLQALAAKASPATDARVALQAAWRLVEKGADVGEDPKIAWAEQDERRSCENTLAQVREAMYPWIGYHHLSLPEQVKAIAILAQESLDELVSLRALGGRRAP